MYKYIGNTKIMNGITFIHGKRMYLSTINDEETSKFRKYKQRCSPIENIARKDDGGILDGWKLQGVLMVIRHGDRGPMSHVRGISNVNCGIEGDMLVHKYKTFLINSTNPSGTNHMYWNKIGPFHGFSLLPSLEKSCLLGQLTYKGIAQLLHIGEIIQQVYLRPLGLYTRSLPSSRQNINSTPNTFLNSDEVIVYSTRYRRTFQSAMALMFTFLPPEKWLSLNVLESHSMAFCFLDCTCPQADVLRKKLALKSNENLQRHAAVSAVVQWIGKSLLQHPSNTVKTPHEVMDAVLSLICHDAELPCQNNKKNLNKNRKNLYPTTGPSSNEPNDLINIDQDEILSSNNYENNFNSLNNGEVNKVNIDIVNDNENNEANTQFDSCIEQSHIAALMSYTNWQSSKEVNHKFYKQIGMLRAYGMIRHIVSFMLRIISGDRTKFVLYSGHDWTMQYLTASLGINTEGVTFIPYAARLSFEVYNSQTDYYFRAVYNGKDVTQQIDFCEGGKSLRVTRDSRGNKADLCPIENIIRFLHEDYFSPLNASNFKDACTVQKSNEF
ncbi:2-phosphoxylose phosphatase 1 isoform X2 [Condylostylus longicornis]|nr:2-phosphoxylose phosphatase 1 isoform X2 [Condylostylus longicornis]